MYNLYRLLAQYQSSVTPMNITQEFYIVILDRSFAKLFKIFFNKVNFFKDI